MSVENVNYSDDEIKKALITIKNICIQHHCSDCVFNIDDDVCSITERPPEEWDIRENPNIKKYLK